MSTGNLFKVHIIEGELAKFQADIIVNSAVPSLQLRCGGLSRSLLNVAGEALQSECDRKYPNGVKFGEVAVTGGYGLKCRQVYHGVLPHWELEKKDTPDGLQILCQFVCACLVRAHQDEVTSIAFPALGTGFLGYPANLAAQTLFFCLAMFQSSHAITSIENVSIIIFTRGADWKHVKRAFQSELTGQLETKSEEESANSRSTYQRSAKFSTTVIRPKSKKSCAKTLPCGHPCFGYNEEKCCLPCIQKRCNPDLSQNAGDECTICYTDELVAAPVIMLKCGHLFHLHCAQRILENKWVGARITFTFSQCPICKAKMEHPVLEPLLTDILALEEDVKRKALTRVQYEGLDKSDAVLKRKGPFYKDPLGFAMNRYCYYQCYKCQKAYFGGTVECEQEANQDVDDFKPEELVCGGCSGAKRDQVCRIHGTDYLEYKCRYCCSVAVFFCFGTTHFCHKCHDHYYKMTRMKHLPKCPAGPAGEQLKGRKCPLNVKHPPTGQEFALGCGVCANVNSF